MSHPYSNAAGYIYANEYKAPFDSGYCNLNTHDQQSAEQSPYGSCSPPPERLEVDLRGVNTGDRRNVDRGDVVRQGQKMATGLRPVMTSCQPTTTTKTTSTSNFYPFSRVFSLSSRTTSNHSHVNPVSAVKHTRPKPTPYDPFAYHPGVYDTQDFIHTDILPEAKSKFPFKFKLTLPNPFRFRTHPRSPVSPWPPDSPLRDTSSPPHTATTTGTSRANSPARPRKGRTAADYGDNDPSSSHWRWSSFESLEPSHLKLKRWFSTKSRTFMKSVAPPRPSTYHASSREFHQGRDRLPQKKSSGNLRRNTTRGRARKGSLRFAQDAVGHRLGPGTGRRAEKDLRFSMVVTP
ncbi:hypothetical protein AGABI1DRAFT_114573 [Agaricus bisporus var. burnettii JB137-S8]|uniref:Uncharacterized protein n=1 Tax=Agaricus bisporus var. burnettii (strain JB137-S8 / ATCC MYA-4627 / FGSC 10392) TaxID=597362 RepID=K5XT88_AGABU|nr:uncharacterized protein AGABI1DRAFT_114573 [Agaricus bisporus var. burnettii JB137-S8]EKM78225.1 hypothetical protein AGABI1DRAFT_114573 [Agaricus bisporus var. burnettii JB137-S8]